MQKWEHLTISRIKFDSHKGYIVERINNKYVSGEDMDFFSYLGELGDEGWEIVAYSEHTYVLKRPVEE
jgi:hypothetical protein